MSTKKSKNNNGQTNGPGLKYNSLTCRNKKQKEAIRAIIDHDVSFLIGPAGTGKTAVAVGIAAQEFCLSHYDRIIITRPAVEAGEKIGFLPGSLEEKLDPYLRPIYDELSQFLVGYQNLKQLFNDRVIEIAPISYLRGRTFKRSLVIIDEAQNCTFKQLRTILTRLGEDSKIIITGDTTQSDLSLSEAGGLDKCVERLEHLSEIGVVIFSKVDIVRHPLIEKMLDHLDQDPADNSRILTVSDKGEIEYVRNNGDLQPITLSR